MAQQDYIVEGRHFRTKGDYVRALRDKETIDRIRSETDLQDRRQLERLQRELREGKYTFYSLLEEDFKEEIEQLLKESSPTSKAKMEARVQEELKKREKRRRLIIASCSLVAVCCLTYVGFYFYYDYRTNSTYRKLSEMREKEIAAVAEAAEGAPTPAPTPQFTLDEEVQEPREVLEEYKSLLNVNQKLIGWVKIDDTNIDYPVMQTVNNEYYLDHNLNQEYDKNGSIFMDKDCDVLKPSTNYIIYGHHMSSGRMFGKLDLYKNQSYCEEHPIIQFDTIYEKGTYEVMYVFRSRVYSENEIVFKYYQFIDANSEQEFNSNMEEMAALSLYDTGVTAQYGDQLLTLSTCDYQEKNGRFVVVAKKIAKE